MDCIVPQVQSGIIGGVIGVVLTLAVVGGIVCFLRMRRRNGEYSHLILDLLYLLDTSIRAIVMCCTIAGRNTF